jgi:hypothetical protein
MAFAHALCLCVPETTVKINFCNGNVQEVSSVVIVTRLWTGRPSLHVQWAAENKAAGA